MRRDAKELADLLSRAMAEQTGQDTVVIERRVVLETTDALCRLSECVSDHRKISASTESLRKELDKSRAASEELSAIVLKRRIALRKAVELLEECLGDWHDGLDERLRAFIDEHKPHT